MRFLYALFAVAVGGAPCAVHATVVPPSGATTEGIDVSHVNGTIDWATVASGNTAFAITAVSTDGTNIDASFTQNWSGIANAGLIRGGYWLFHPLLDATTQANEYLAAVGTLGSRDLPPILDVEITESQTPTTILIGIEVWTGQVRAATGRKPIIYTSSGFWNGTLGNPDVAYGLLWIAQWGVAAPNIPDPPWTTWVIWQYSDTGTVSGVPGSGSLDQDKFNGSLTDLQAFADRIFMDGFEP
jgi:lysozyme